MSNTQYYFCKKSLQRLWGTEAITWAKVKFNPLQINVRKEMTETLVSLSGGIGDQAYMFDVVSKQKTIRFSTNIEGIGIVHTFTVGLHSDDRQ